MRSRSRATSGLRLSGGGPKIRRSHLRTHWPSSSRTVSSAGLEIPEAKKFVLVSGPEFKAFSLWDDGTVSELSVIPAQEKAARLDEQHAVLGERKVSLVGCGSLGSKVATMLARAGVGRFLLVDDDLMLPHNLVRHDLDWRD